MKKQNARIAKVKATTYEIDIAQEFKDVKSEIAGLKNEISGWQKSVDTQLSRLNDNMDKVLNLISNHEFRISAIEKHNLTQETRTKTITEMSKFMWFVAKGLVGIGIIAAGILGTAGAWKIIFPA